MGNSVYIAGTGTYLPGEPVAFDDIQAYLGPLPDAPARIRSWIEKSTPIMKQLLAVKVFYYAFDRNSRAYFDDNISMSVKAARIALDHAGLQPSDIDLICYGSAHHDQMPTASVRIQESLGIDTCDDLSIHANCTSAYKALYLAQTLIESGKNRRALVVSSNVSSSELRAEYYNQPKADKDSLFLRWFLCDGAGALVLTSDPAESCGFRVAGAYIESIGGKKPSMMYNLRPAYWESPRIEFDNAQHHLRQSFRNALSTDIFQEKGGSVFIKGLQRMLARFNVAASAIRLFQVNLPARHIVESVIDECRALGIDAMRFYSKLDTMGYCGPPTALICLDRIVREEQLSPGDIVASFVTEVSKFMQAGYIIEYGGK